MTKIAELAWKARLSIAYFELKWVPVAGGNKVVVAEFNIDIYRLSSHQFDNFVCGVKSRADDGTIDLIRDPLHD